MVDRNKTKATAGSKKLLERKGDCERYILERPITKCLPRIHDTNELDGRAVH